MEFLNIIRNGNEEKKLRFLSLPPHKNIPREPYSPVLTATSIHPGHRQVLEKLSLKVHLLSTHVITVSLSTRLKLLEMSHISPQVDKETETSYCSA